MNGTMTKIQNALIPTTLDQIITRHRDDYSLQLSSDEDLAGLQKSIVAAECYAADEIIEWRVVCLERNPALGRKAHILLGDVVRTGVPLSTSPVLYIDRGSRWVVTASGSMYRLAGMKAPGEPPLLHMLHLCRTLHHWKIGELLGVRSFPRQLENGQSN